MFLVFFSYIGLFSYKLILLKSIIAFKQNRDTYKHKHTHKHRNSVLVANNLYDSKYIEYFTGLRVPVLPLSAVYLKQQLPQVFDPNVESSILAQSFIYNPTNPSFLLSPVHSDELFTKFFKEFNSLLTEVIRIMMIIMIVMMMMIMIIIRTRVKMAKKNL